MPLTLVPGALSGSQGLAVPVSVRAPAAYALAVPFGVQSAPPVRLAVPVTVASTPPAAPSASPLVEHTVSLTGLPGAVLGATYRHTGAAEELEVTVSGLWPLASPTVGLSVESRVVLPDAHLLGRLNDRVFAGQSQEPEVSRAAGTTTFRYRSGFDAELRGVKLPETVPWKVSPSTDPCLTTRRTLGVSAHVQALMRAWVDSQFGLEYDPLPQSKWVEGRDDFTTLGLTPQAVWDATYGVLGMVLQVRRSGTGVRLVGTWDQPVQVLDGPALAEAWQTGREQARQWYQTPRRVTVTGAPSVTPLTPQRLLDWIGPDDDLLSLQREILPDAEWYDAPESSGTASVQRGTLKLAGQVVRQVEVTTGDVTVTETVDGEQVSRALYGVGTGVKLTATQYDPACPTRPLVQRMTTLAWGYDLHTELGSYSVPGPGLYTTLSVGDLVGDETTLTTCTYSPQGYLSARTTSTRRLASVQQSGADGPAADRGALSGREYVRQTVTERWTPTGSGLWQYDPGTAGQTLLPVYDADSGDAVRTVAVVRASPEAPRLTDQAPPTYDCRTTCGVMREVADPTGAVLYAGDAGLAEERTLNLDVLSPADLVGAARQVMASAWNRVQTTVDMPFAYPFQPGDWTADGLVRDVQLTLEGGRVTSRATCAALDLTLLPPASAVLEAYRLPPDSGTATMLTRRPGGARARIVTGWDAEEGAPITTDAFVGFRSGFPPAPGDELEWQMGRGVREATNGRR